MTDLVIVAFPLAQLKTIRATHDIPYRNDRQYDYAMGPKTGTPAIPWCLEQWADTGLDLTRKFVHRMWTELADKRGPETHQGEHYRCAKLVLDAFAHVYDIAALSELGGLQVRYSGSQDLNGIDYHVMHPVLGTISVQISRSASRNDYRPTKMVRRAQRGANSIASLDLRVADLDKRRQPFVPTDEWYRSSHELIISALGANA